MSISWPPVARVCSIWVFGAADYDYTRTHLETHGFDPSYTVQLAGSPRETVYFEPPAGFGSMIEVSTATPQKQPLFDAIAALGIGGDGSDPVRRYPTMAAFAASAGVPSWSSQKA